MKVEAWMNHQASFPANSLPSLAEHYLLFRKKLTRPLKRTVSEIKVRRELLQD